MTIPTNTKTLHAASLSHQQCQRSSMGNMHLSNGRVSIRFEQPEDAAHTAPQELDSLTARQCRAHIASNPQLDSGFFVKLDGRVPLPVTEVVFERSLLEKLPLLLDVERSTSDRNPAKISLPCPLWGLVSLLILLEGSVTVKEWLGGSNGDATLPGDTLAVAEFMGCLNMRREIISWLQDGLRCVVKHCMAELTEHANPALVPTAPSYAAHIWHLTQVLRHVHGEHDREVLSIINPDADSPAAALGEAICLPHHLLRKWVASTTPNLDFSGVILTPAQCSRLAVCIAQLPPDAIESLQISARSNIDDMSHHVKGALNEVHKRRYHHDPPPYADRFSNSMSFEFMHMLGAVEAAVTNMSNLQHFGLFYISLTPHLIPALEQLLGSLPNSVTKLTLDTERYPNSVQFGEVHKRMFFRAVSRVESLQELHMQGWEQFVGSTASVCAEPLQSMPGLRIFVPTVRVSDTFPPGLVFVPTEATQ